MNIFEIFEIEHETATERSAELSKFELWFEDLEEAAVDQVWIAESDDQIVGFLTKNLNGECVAIEVLESARGKGVASQLCEEAWCFVPEDNQCPEFWKKMADLQETL